MTGIKQLAQHLGVSIGTVSRALNNRHDAVSWSAPRAWATLPINPAGACGKV
jgi:Bacterial regulatory proteins, lacI family